MNLEMALSLVGTFEPGAFSLHQFINHRAVELERAGSNTLTP